MSPIAYRPGPDTKHGATQIWRDGYKAAMTTIETCLLAGDVESITRHVSAALAETRGRPKGRPRPSPAASAARTPHSDTSRHAHVPLIAPTPYEPPKQTAPLNSQERAFEATLRT